jgi:ABC-type polar amino acid transport system ATPase subunit/GNAT superfamily N-acetyltransferase
MKATITRSTPIQRTARVMQLEGLFEVPPSKHSEIAWSVNLPIEERTWNIGLIVGASGSGKTTLAREMFGDNIVSGFEWSADRSVVDDFPREMPIKDVVQLLNSVGFSSPPCWLRPFRVLSNGEQFRVTMARAIAEADADVFVVDEFTSVVDRTVARIGSSAIARAVREKKRKFIALSCHYDIVDWLQPDWVYDPGCDSFQWRELQRRPTVSMEVRRVDKSAWRIFRHNHYLDTELNGASACFCGFVDGAPATFCAVLGFPHAIRPGWRLHRLVCLPDYQGIGLGTALSDYVSGLYRASGKPVFRTASHPAVVSHCARSKAWAMHTAPTHGGQYKGSAKNRSLAKTDSVNRLVAGFEYVGLPLYDDAAKFGLQVKR